MTTPLVNEMVGLALVRSEEYEANKKQEHEMVKVSITNTLRNELVEFKRSCNINVSTEALIWKLLNFATLRKDDFIQEQYQGTRVSKARRDRKAKEKRAANAKPKPEAKEKVFIVCVCGKRFEFIKGKREKFCGRECPRRYIDVDTSPKRKV